MGRRPKHDGTTFGTGTHLHKEEIVGDKMAVTTNTCNRPFTLRVLRFMGIALSDATLSFTVT